MTERETEKVSAASTGLDTWTDSRILDALLAGQDRALAAVRIATPQIARASTLLADRLRAGGRLFYAGAGTSIRIAVQDGSELPATFGFPEDRVHYLIAGGPAAIFETLASAEDDEAAGARDAAQCKTGDTVIAVAASGSTPYTVAAAGTARANGAAVIAVTNNPGSPLAAAADLEICLSSGPEVIAGSTRLGAGTAQKAALNLLSTLTFVKLGAVYDGLMVNVQADNAKLRARAAGIVSAIAGVPPPKAAQALADAGGRVKPAVLLLKGAPDLPTAEQLLGETHDILRLAMARAAGP